MATEGLKLRIFLTATSYPRSEQDWQGIFIRRMCDALAAAEPVRLRVWAPPGPLHPDARSALSAGDEQFLRALADEGGIAHLLRTSQISGVRRALELVYRMRAALNREERQTDVLHLNWLQCALASRATRLPLLVTVLGSDLALLAKPWMRMLVRRSLRGKRAVLCPNAQWMVSVLRSALGDTAPEIRYVPFGLDRHWYEVQHQDLDGPLEWLTVLRVTPRKIGRLFAWTRDIDPGRHLFHLFGPMQEPVEIPPWIHYHGPVTPASLASEWYPRAAGMISLSEHDEGRPQVLLEAMASGLPVICSRIPAHCDLLESLGAGRLVDSCVDFNDAIVAMENSENRRLQADKGRLAIRDGFGTWEDCARRYTAIYRELAESRRPL